MASDVTFPLQVHDVAKQYGVVAALRGVSFNVARDEVVALIGDNGAGKSTLVKIISGLIAPTSGTISVDGVERGGGVTPSEAQDMGIQTVFQDLALIPTLDIAENIYLHREIFHTDPIRSRLKWMDRRAMRHRAEEGLADLGVTLPPTNTKVAALSGGQRQSVAIARAVLWGRKIVLLDEPTAALGVQQTEMVLSFIERLRDRGVSVIVVSHNMEEVLRVSDRIVVMRLGRVAADLRKEDATHEALVKFMIGL